MKCKIVFMPNHYQLSPFYRLSPKEIETTTLHNILSEETYLINTIIHTFLSFFQEKAITFMESIELFMEEFGGERETVTATVNPFFGDMFYQSILIRAENYTHLSNFPVQKKKQELSILKDFDLIKTLSEEYFLSIYVIQNKKTKAQSVLKILHLNAFYTPEEKKIYHRAFLQEIKILEEVKQHPSIIQLLCHSQNKELLTLELEYVNGVGLRQFIYANPSLTFAEKKKIFSNVINAYSHLHFLDVLHGDIHASNILILENHDVKLIDFDMSYHNGRRRGELISKGGVQAYIAPEKISENAFEIANKRANFRSEVYQIGIIAYIIFMNDLPFEADSWKLLATKIKKEKPFFDSLNLPSNLISFLQRALAKKPSNRFASAVEMATVWEKKILDTF